MSGEFDWIADADALRRRPAAGTPVSPLGRGSISACLVVRNEAATIARCLESLADVVDEIVVVHDGPCADNTLQIASRAGCRLFVAPAYGHSEHHLPFAYEQACGEWLLTIDADEFLSPQLRKELRQLAAAGGAGGAGGIDGYEFLWKLWRPSRYVTERGPYKLALVRRAAMRLAGIIHSKGEVDGVVRRMPLLLEHRPVYDNFSLRTIATKWRGRARLQAREYLMDLNTLPRFNYPGLLRWTRRREWMNRWAPLLVVPAAVHTFFFVLSRLSSEIDFLPRVRFALTQAVYRAMVTAYVAIEGRGKRPRSTANDPLSRSTN